MSNSSHPAPPESGPRPNTLAISDQWPDDADESLIAYSAEEIATCLRLIAQALTDGRAALAADLVAEIRQAAAMIARAKEVRLPVTPLTYNSAAKLVDAIGVYVSDLAVRAHEINENGREADCVFARELVASIQRLSVNLALTLHVLPS